MRSRNYRRVAHGLYVPRPSAAEAFTMESHLAHIRATRLLLPPDAVFTHVTASRLLGWHLPALPEQVPIFAAVRGSLAPRRPGIICSRLTHDSPSVEVALGLRVDSPIEVLLRAARDLGELDLTIMADSALRAEHIEASSLDELVGQGRPGTRVLRRALASADGRAESPGETLLRRFHDVLEIPTSPQVSLHDDDGRFLGRADLLVTGSHHVHEYDGAVHRGARAHTADLRRDRGWSAVGFTRRGFTMGDLVTYPSVTAQELDRALGRRHDPRRVHRWTRLLEESLFSPVCRERVMNRWFRMPGPH